MKNILASLAAATWFVLPPYLFAEEAAKLPPPSDRKDVTFAADIKPIFDRSCVECHGPKKKKGGLRLDTRELALKGASHGPVFKPGDSANSELVKLVARIGDEENWMPPIGKGKPLTKEQVGLLRAWIDQGAK